MLSCYFTLSSPGNHEELPLVVFPAEPEIGRHTEPLTDVPADGTLGTAFGHPRLIDDNRGNVGVIPILDGEGHAEVPIVIRKFGFFIAIILSIRPKNLTVTVHTSHRNQRGGQTDDFTPKLKHHPGIRPEHTITRVILETLMVGQQDRFLARHLTDPFCG